MGLKLLIQCPCIHLFIFIIPCYSVQGVLEHCEESSTADTQRALVKEKCQELLAAGCESPFLLGFLVELLQYQLEEDTMTEKAELISTATDLCVRLSKDIDTVRCRYWDFVSDTITSKHSAQA